MAELADAADSKSAEVHPSWGFNSPSRHHRSLFRPQGGIPTHSLEPTVDHLITTFLHGFTNCAGWKNVSSKISAIVIPIYLLMRVMTGRMFTSWVVQQRMRARLAPSAASFSARNYSFARGSPTRHRIPAPCCLPRVL